MRRKYIFWIICLGFGISFGIVTYHQRTTSVDIGEVSGVEQVSAAVQMRIDNGETGVMIFDDLKVKKQVTALDLLERLALEEGFSLVIERSGLGEYISGIGGKVADESHFWAFLINGEMSQVGAGDYQLVDGDTIEFGWTEF